VNIGQITVTIIAALLSGIIATICSNIYYTNQKKLQKKIDLLDDIFGYRYQMSSGYSGATNDIIRAINRIPIVYAKSKEAINAYNEYNQSVIDGTSTDDKLITLLKKLCSDAKINSDGWNDSYIKNVILSKNLK
jgi:hypothetical protein